ncbi:hypothetical protein PIB30_022430 [Stylosanthes scabra]|uniref:Spermidine hydroxycinnamoyl transferase n=1 Tax=Stylosanthes scabra TaxID=79078 RepID=A0ABU6Q9G9_9FABA|nr:hypothetical protein [Stylosanthes scabra]
MVTILDTHTVIPREETPKGLVHLSDNDQLWRWSHTPSIYVYKPTQNSNNNNLIERMRDSLSEILIHYYPLAGRLNWTKGSRLELDCNSKGVLLLEAESSKSMAEYGGFLPNNPSVKELVPTVDYSRPINELPLFLAQVTKFKGSNDGGGFVIGTALSHPLADGISAIRFINAWAKLTRGATLDPANDLPFLDRTILKPSHPVNPPRFDHPEFKPLPLILGRTDNLEEQKKKTTFARLDLNPEHVQKLKKNANKNAIANSVDDNQNGSERPYSRFEVICAHIWRSACKARKLQENQPTVVKFNGDIRSRLQPPLPHNYFGNALSPTVTPVCYVKEITTRPLSFVAEMIREAVKKFSNPEYVKSQMDYVAGFEGRWDLIRTPHSEKGEYRTDIPFFGNPNIILGSWMSLPVYEADFGSGKPFYFGHGGLCPYDRGIIALAPDDGDNGGGVVVFMNFQEEHMKDFIKFFWEDI